MGHSNVPVTDSSISVVQVKYFALVFSPLGTKKHSYPSSMHWLTIKYISKKCVSNIAIDLEGIYICSWTRAHIFRKLIGNFTHIGHLSFILLLPFVNELKDTSFTDASIQRCKLCWVYVQELWNCKWWWSGRNWLAPPLLCSSSVLFHLFSCYTFSLTKMVWCFVQQRSWRKRVPNQSGQPSRHCLVMSQPVAYVHFASPLSLSLWRRERPTYLAFISEQRAWTKRSLFKEVS